MPVQEIEKAGSPAAAWRQDTAYAVVSCRSGTVQIGNRYAFQPCPVECVCRTTPPVSVIICHQTACVVEHEVVAYQQASLVVILTQDYPVIRLLHDVTVTSPACFLPQGTLLPVRNNSRQGYIGKFPFGKQYALGRQKVKAPCHSTIIIGNAHRVPLGDKVQQSRLNGCCLLERQGAVSRESCGTLLALGNEVLVISHSGNVCVPRIHLPIRSRGNFQAVQQTARSSFLW